MDPMLNYGAKMLSSSAVVSGFEEASGRYASELKLGSIIACRSLLLEERVCFLKF